MVTYLDKQPAIIAVMGATGVGKSSFINSASGHRLAVGHALDSCTQEIQEVRMEWGKEKTPVLLVDTPGFGGSSMSDTEVLRLIAKYLVTSAGTKLAGVIYMHRISDSKVEGGTRRNFRMFQQLCGSEHLQQVVVVTTWWDQVNKQVAEQRERQLRESEALFKPMLNGGASLVRHEMLQDNGYSSAQSVLDHLFLPRVAINVKLQTQLVVEKKPLPATDAGSIISDDLTRKAKQCVSRLVEVHEGLKRTKDLAIWLSLEAERKDLQEEKKAFRKQIKALSKTLNERFVL
ncbi:P-loop containing nucleoside triphosphate hydrolase protein [Rickenella mellea]|uniref:P-loop containing nucleoside triphosphate hydrolase protein n=1 Tax=Rickenella mellea TaxID=50990 RepID=A0A4Y7PSF7_9AGAM|nr:P-loop containing nucleoside triphosphate hydrolase protein [Rickenella mellea]